MHLSGNKKSALNQFQSVVICEIFVGRNDIVRHPAYVSGHFQGDKKARKTPVVVFYLGRILFSHL